MDPLRNNPVSLVQADTTLPWGSDSRRGSGGAASDMRVPGRSAKRELWARAPGKPKGSRAEAAWFRLLEMEAPKP